MTKMAKEKVLEQYALERLIKDMDQLYQKTLRRKGLIK
jgi:hypothetical protein